MNPSSNKPLVPENIEQLNRYVAGKTIAEVVETYNITKIAKLASNENRYGFSPKVNDAVIKALPTIMNYPDPVSRDLRTAIAKKNGVNPEQVLVASGSESIISMLCRTFFLNKENAISCSATFVGFFVQIGVRGVHLKKIPPTKDYRFDVKATVNAIDENTKMIYVANPNNPTGTYITKSEFEWMMERVPEDVLVVMDDAYYEFAVGVDDYPDALTYGFDNVIILRTFSKAYGLAGFRVGYAIANETIINYLLKTKLTFEPGTLGQVAALAAYDDEVFLQQSVNVVNKSKSRLYDFFDENGVNYAKSISNSVMMIFDTEKEAIDFTQGMLEKGVILRRINAFGLPKCVRISMGIQEEMDHFEEAFLEVFKQIKVHG